LLAIIAAVLFGLAVILDLAATTLGRITAGTLVAAGLLCMALHMAGIGTTVRGGNWRRRRR
jgi:hypothetical protein